MLTERLGLAAERLNSDQFGAQYYRRNHSEMVMITQAILKEHLHYCPDSGEFTWIKRTGPRCKIGSVAGTLHHEGYLRIKLFGRFYAAHRLAFLYLEGRFPSAHVDHINHIRSDNRWDNLRHATRQENNQNASMRSDNSSGVTGVSWDKRKGKWRADIKVGGKQKTIGRFDSIDDAIRERRAAERKFNYHENHGSELLC